MWGTKGEWVKGIAGPGLGGEGWIGTADLWEIWSYDVDGPGFTMHRNSSPDVLLSRPLSLWPFNLVTGRDLRSYRTMQVQHRDSHLQNI